MLRGANSNSINENGASSVRNKDKLNAMTPRRAFGVINVNTPRTCLKSAKSELFRQNCNETKKLVFEDPATADLVDLAPASTDISEAVPVALHAANPTDDSFDALCAKSNVVLSPWNEVPAIERPMPPSPAVYRTTVEDLKEDLTLGEKSLHDEKEEELEIEHFTRRPLLSPIPELQDMVLEICPEIEDIKLDGYMEPNVLLEIYSRDDESTDEELEDVRLFNLDDSVEFQALSDYEVEVDAAKDENEFDDDWDEIVEKVRRCEDL